MGIKLLVVEEEKTTFYTHRVESSAAVAKLEAALAEKTAELKRANISLNKVRIENRTRHNSFEALDRATRARFEAAAKEPWHLVAELKKELESRVKDRKVRNYQEKRAREALAELAQALMKITELEAALAETKQELGAARKAADKLDKAVDARRDTQAKLVSCRKELTTANKELNTAVDARKGVEAARDAARDGAAVAAAKAEAAREAAAKKAAAAAAREAAAKLLVAEGKAAAKAERARMEKEHTAMEVELRARMDEHAEEHRQLALALRAKLPPAPNRRGGDWETLGDTAARQARHRDVEHLEAVLREKEYRVEDVATALCRAGMVKPLFDTLEFCDQRMAWLFELRQFFYDDSWNARMVLHLKCDLLLSQRRIDKIRNLLCKDFLPELEGSVPRTWWTNPHTQASIAYPEPVVSRYRWQPAWYALKARFNLRTDADGRVVRADFFEAFDRMLGRDIARMEPLTSFTKEWPMRICIQFDGTGLWKWALCHGAIKNGSYTDRVSQHSERLLETLFVAHAGDGHASMLEIMGDWAPPPHVPFDPTCLAAQIAQLIEAGEYTFNGVTFPCEVTFACDHKGVESFRGCGHCSPWCCCSHDQKHTVPFDGDLRKIEAADYDAIVAEGKRVCKYPVSNTLASSMGHTIGKGQTLPPPCQSRMCADHGRAPYASNAQWTAANAAIAKVTAAAKTPAEKRAVASTRTEYASRHLHQKRGEKFLAPVSSMALVPVELLHHLYLNDPKMLFKWLIKRHLSFASRMAASEYFSDLGCGIDLKTKAEGRVTEDKWFSGADWQKIVEGTDKSPGGLPTVITYLVGLMGNDLEILPAAERRRRASVTERRRARGETFDETAAHISDSWGEETGSPMLLALRGFDAYLELYVALNEKWFNGESEASVREGRALRVFKAAAKMGKYMEAVATTHKSWTLHIAMWILFRHVARYGDLWRFSSGALEQRGAQLKRIGSCVACLRPRVVAKGVDKEGKKISTHNSSAQQDMFQITNARQDLMCSSESVRFGSREAKALLTGLAGGQSGRMTMASKRTKSRLDELTEGGGGSSVDAWTTQHQ